MNPEEIPALIEAMANENSESTLESFFMSHGLGDAFNSPGEGWGKRKKINAALSKAESLGTRDAILRAANARFGGSPEGDGAEERARDPESLLRDLLQEAHEIDVADAGGAESVLSRARMAVGQLFGDSSSYADRLNSIRFQVSTPRQRLDRVAGTDQWRISQTELVATLETAVEHMRTFGLPKEKQVAETRARQEEPTRAEDTRAVFVVHGRDEGTRRAMFDFLRSIELRPIEWTKARKLTGKPSPYIGEVLSAAFNAAQAVVVVFTPDDEARLLPEFRESNDPPHETNLTPQARPNVLFEAGMAMGAFPERTILVQIGSVRPFTDISGIHLVNFDGSTEARQELAQRLADARCEIGISGVDWHTAGDFPAR